MKQRNRKWQGGMLVILLLTGMSITSCQEKKEPDPKMPAVTQEQAAKRGANSRMNTQAPAPQVGRVAPAGGGGATGPSKQTQNTQ